MKKVRCAIYTRKSSEEGLEQDFNSLHAQREACAAYVLSQASEGWSLLADAYDDGGLSGGSLERPALKRLLGAIEDGRIDIVVVYKVDRLTRSLLDFARLVETMDKAGVSFVSVTQSFNTTNSMGRLTLNMLLSFAQFEREVTAERIRDKIAASKAKGMWMGGIAPLGYEPDGRTLKVVDEHAVVIRDIFARYLAAGNVRRITEAMEQQGVRAPHRRLANGREIGGGAFTRGQIYRVLSNPVYIGEIHHKGHAHPARHEAIIDRGSWEQVQAQLAANKQGEERRTRARSPSLLAGKVHDQQGEPLVASHACKGKLRYRYYVSRNRVHAPGAEEPGCRMPALELEKVVCEAIASAIRQPLGLVGRAGLALAPGDVARLAHAAPPLAERVATRERAAVRELVHAVHIEASGLTVQLDTVSLLEALGCEVPADAPPLLSLSVLASLSRSGRAMRLLQPDGCAAGTPEPQAHLARLIHRARCWWNEMVETGLTTTAFARQRGVTSSYVSRLIRLNFLAPEIIAAIVSGSCPAALDGKALLNLGDLPLDWSRQKALLLS